jgi:hypothetical protein
VSPESRLIVHYEDEVLPLTAHDLERVKEAIGVLEESLESFQVLLVDSRTAGSLHQAGNGDTRGDITEITDDLIDLVGAGLLEVQAPELDINRFEVLCSEFEKCTDKVGEAFEAKEEVAPSTVDQIADHVVTGGVLAALLDVLSAFGGLLGLLNEIKQETAGA